MTEEGKQFLSEVKFWGFAIGPYTWEVIDMAKYTIKGDGFFVEATQRNFALNLIKALSTPSPVEISNGKVEVRGFKTDLAEFIEKATFF